MAEQPKPAVRTAKHDTVPTLFADGLFGASVTSSVARLELFADHFEPAVGGMQPTIVGRLVMPAEKLDGFVRGLSELVQRLQSEKAKSEVKTQS
jgi:hypothetical protein